MFKQALLILILATYQVWAQAPPDISESPKSEILQTEPPPAEESLPAEEAPAEQSEPTTGYKRHNEGPAPVQKESSSSGEKIFDWSKHQGETQVPHPFAEKGLIRITRGKEYLYRVPESKSSHAMSVQLGLLNPQNLANPDAPVGDRGATFQENYDQSSNPTVLVTKEWTLLRGALGKIDLRAGSGAFVAQGHGHFVSAENANLTPKEVLTFVALPNNLGVVYRLQFFDRPLFVPYAEGGGTAWVFGEFRDDKKGPKFGASPGAYAAGGLALNMTYFDYLSRIQLDREYGITGVYLTAEYRKIFALSTRFDFSSDFVNAGFLMEY